jgi:hypothetical protein
MMAPMRGVLLFALAMLPSVALAQANVEEANERMQRGESLYRAGDYDAAVAEFERAYEVIGEDPSRFVILYNIARAHERRFRYDLAMRYYRRFLEEGGPEAPQRPQVEAAIESLEGLLATVRIELAPAELRAEVWIEDRQVGEAPGDVLVPGGRHVIEVRAEGYAPARHELQIAPRTSETISLRLSSYSSGLEPAWFWGATIAGVVSLAAGASLGGAALVLDDQLGQVGPVEAETTDYEAENARIQALAVGADVFVTAAAIFGATAFVLALFTRFEAAPASRAVRARGPSLEVAF